MRIQLAKPLFLVLALLPPATALAGTRVDIVSEGGGAKLWLPAPDAPAAVPGFPSVVADKSEQACVSIGYQVGADGSTSGFTLLKSWSSKGGEKADAATIDPFARNAIAAVQRWKFVPAKPGKLRSIYTSASFSFDSSAAPSPVLRERCKIENLSAFIAKAQADAYRRGNLKKGEIDRNQSQYAPQIPVRVGVH